jgi:hypothetical protein
MPLISLQAVYVSFRLFLALLTVSVAIAFFFVARSKFIPRIQPGKSTRWDYDFVEFGEMEMSYTELATEDDFPALMRSDDEWTVGESSSIASGDVRDRDRSPSVTSGEMEISYPFGKEAL